MIIIRSFFCENVITDTETKNATIYNLFEEISSIGFPILIPKITLYLFCENEMLSVLTHELDLKMFINELNIFSNQLRIAFPNNSNKARAIARFNGIVIPSPGSFSVRLYYRGEPKPFHDVRLNILQSQQMTTSPGN